MTLLELTASPLASWADVSAEHGLHLGPLAPLNPAERVVAMQVRLGKSECTIKNQVSACLRKFGLRSRAQLIVRLA